MTKVFKLFQTNYGNVSVKRKTQLGVTLFLSVKITG